MVLSQNKSQNKSKSQNKNKKLSKKLFKKGNKKYKKLLKGGNNDEAKTSITNKKKKSKLLSPKLKKRDKKTHKKRKKNKNNQKGGRKSALSNIVKDIRQSERSLLHNYKKYASEAKKYFTSFNKHIDNLATLDNNIPDTKSFKSIFLNTLMPNHITNQMRGESDNPLFLSNYLIDDYSSPNDIQYQHIQQQIRYVLNKYISLTDQSLLDLGKIAVHSINENSISIDFVTAGYQVYEINCMHDKLEINLDDLGLKIKSFLDKVKSGIEIQFKNVPDKSELISDSIALPALQMQPAMTSSPGLGMGASPASNTSGALDAEKEQKIQDILREMAPSDGNLGTGIESEDDKAFGKL